MFSSSFVLPTRVKQQAFHLPFFPMEETWATKSLETRRLCGASTPFLSPTPTSNLTIGVSVSSNTTSGSSYPTLSWPHPSCFAASSAAFTSSIWVQGRLVAWDWSTWQSGNGTGKEWSHPGLTVRSIWPFPQTWWSFGSTCSSCWCLAVFLYTSR